MHISFTIPITVIERLKHRFHHASVLHAVVIPAFVLSLLATTYFYFDGSLIAYGDTESHLNIAKRVVHSLTPGIAQLGGIWLPLPHILMIPFVSIDFLWRTGLAGSIVSGAAYIITAIYIFRLMQLIVHNRLAAVVASWVFMLNPNILYLQSTAMTELPLIAFFTVSSFYFLRFIKKTQDILSLLLAAFFAFLSVLSRYDGWFLVGIQALLLVAVGLKEKWKIKKIEGIVVLYGTLAFFGIALWLLWGQAILGNALYFTQSEFSAKTQQQAWLAKGQLPAYHDIGLAIAYYFVTSYANAGIVIFFASFVGFVAFLKNKDIHIRWFVAFLLLVPFIFNALTLFIGQSVIFIPHLTPVSFEWRLFNVRYGTMILPAVSLFFAYIFSIYKSLGKAIIIGSWVLQVILFSVGYSTVVSYQDGIEGLSHAKRPDAEQWMREHYDGGLVLLDDYARTISIVRSNLPMQNIIYIGNKPYWQESLVTPEKYARWVVMQKSDAVWTQLEEDATGRDRLYTYFEKVYTSPDILIFRKRSTP